MCLPSVPSSSYRYVTHLSRGIGLPRPVFAFIMWRLRISIPAPFLRRVGWGQETPRRQHRAGIEDDAHTYHSTQDGGRKVCGGREEDCLFGLKSTDGLCPLHFSSVHFQSRLSRPIYRSRLKIGWWRQGQRTNGLRKMSAWQSALWCVPFRVEITPRYAYPALVFWMTESCCTLLCTETSLCMEALAFWLASRWRSQHLAAPFDQCCPQGRSTRNTAARQHWTPSTLKQNQRVFSTERRSVSSLVLLFPCCVLLICSCGSLLCVVLQTCACSVRSLWTWWDGSSNCKP